MSADASLKIFNRFYRTLRDNRQIKDVLVAIIIGVLCGLASVILQLLIARFSIMLWGESHLSVEFLSDTAAWKKILIPALGGLIIGPVVYFFAKEAKGHGVPEVMAAVSLKGGIIRAKVSVAKLFASAMTIASGGSAGREGPIIQIGGAIGSWVGQRFKVSSNRIRTFVGCGSAAGIAATFNAPIAGALFSIEVILRDFGVTQFGPIVIAAVMATTVARGIMGDTPVFDLPAFELISVAEYIPFILLGLACGLVSVLFTKCLYFTHDIFDYKLKKIPGWLQPAIGGLATGLLGIYAFQIFGDGHGVISLSLVDALPWKLLLILLFAKILATSFTLGSGGSGGVFAPALFIGAMTGALVGKASGLFLGELAGSPGGYALAAMGGVVAGTTHAPITAILIIFEITNNYSIILPLMTVCIISTITSSLLMKDSIYTLKLLRRGITLFQKQSFDLMKRHKVKDFISDEYEVIPPDLPALTMIKQLISSEYSRYYVVDEEERFSGVVTMDDARRLLINQDNLGSVLLAEDLCNEDVPHCYNADNLSQVLRKFERSQQIELPVMDKSNPHKLIGVLEYVDVLGKYNDELVRYESSESLTSRALNTSKHKVKIVEGFSMIDWDPPSSAWGKTLSESMIGRKYAVYVILAKKPSKDGVYIEPVVPNRDYLVEQGDTLVIYGSDAAIERAKNI